MAKTLIEFEINDCVRLAETWKRWQAGEIYPVVAGWWVLVNGTPRQFVVLGHPEPGLPSRATFNPDYLTFVGRADELDRPGCQEAQSPLESTP